MSFLVDTDICSVYLKGDRRVSGRFMQYAGALSISAVTIAELYSWAFRTSQSNSRLAAVDNLCREAEVVDVNTAIALRCGKERAAMLNKGLVLPIPDMLIASTALHLNYKVVTHNTRNFSMVPNVRLEDWLVP